MRSMDFVEGQSGISRQSETLRGLREAIPVFLSFVPFALLLGAQATQKA